MALVFRIAANGGGSSTCADGAWVTGSAVGTYALEMNASGIHRYLNDGANAGGVSVPSGSGLPLGATVSSAGDGPAFSVSAWIYPSKLYDATPDESANWRVIVGRDGAGTTGYNGWKISMDGARGRNGQISWSPGGYASAGAPGRAISADNAIEVNKWHLVVGIWDPSETTNKVKLWIYKEGAASTLVQTSYSNLTFTPGPGDENIGIGGWDAYENDNHIFGWMGKIDDVAIWNVALDSGSVNNLWNSGNGAAATTVSSSNIAAYYSFEEGAGNNTVIDRSGNGHTGTLLNLDSGSC